MIVRSRAPLRLGLAGGGTDVSPYSDIHGGAVLNATINSYAYALIRPTEDGRIVIRSIDLDVAEDHVAREHLNIDGPLVLSKSVYNRVVKDFVKRPLSFELLTYVDIPPGSGLGTSSTLTVSILGAFAEWLNLPLGEYDIARLAYEIERRDASMAGGKQDQYAAAFGGFNFMEFYNDDKVIVNPLRVKHEYVRELEFSLVMYYTGISRESSRIISEQSRNVDAKYEESISAMDKLKEQAFVLKEAILKGELHRTGEILDFGWQYKKKIAIGITNRIIDEIYNCGVKAGSTGGKLSGAGAGGFLMFYCPGNTKYTVIDALKRFGGEIARFEFTKQGLITWKER